ncbi:pyridoxal phosphate-dependent aminotransferase [Calorimonas adulescens]|uniref:Aminotransferase n=1 Tax=Calorimonas adulescens TaxID=2606906 RepID=A0A5D8Q945_9THEO|nr:pyridoxal phosphate-dependent aminotransferase [Calorimonas adulescens]TZE80897.1 pyridoxal phosphate-dependent aminotransferase [Calorimonas adulescens]
MEQERYLSDRVKSIQTSEIRHFFNMAGEVKGAISLSLGQPDFVTPKHIIDAAVKALNEGHTFYTHNMGLLELRKEISHFLSRRHSITYNPDTEIIVTIGVSQAIDTALRALVSEGDEVIIPQPSFVTYKPCVIMAGAVPKFVPTFEEDNFILRPDILESNITERTKVLILNYPNNPTGAIMTRDELAAIAEVVKRRDLIVISDEIYSELTYGVDYTSFASLPDMWDRTITVNGFSKTYAMTGWRLGYIAAPEGFIKEMVKVHQYTVTCAPSMGQYAAIEALKNGDNDIKNMVEEYDKRRKFLLDEVRNMGLHCFEPRGAFYIFPSIKNTSLTSDEFATRLLYEGKVAVVPGTAFGKNGEGFIRLSYASSMDDLKEAAKRMRDFLKKL